MGWIILIAILFLILLPLCIPIIIRLQWQGEGIPIWSVHYGKILIAPGGQENAQQIFKSWSEKFSKVAKYFKPVFFLLKWILKGLVFLFGGLFLVVGFLFRIISYPFIKLFQFSRKIFSRQKKQDLDEFESLDKDESKDFTDDDAGSDTQDEPEYYPGEEQTEPLHEKPSSRETSGQTEETSEGQRKDIPGFSFFKRILARLNTLKDSNKKNRDLFEKYYGYYKEYSPLVFRTLRRIFRLLGRYWKALKWRTFRVQLSTGGDPSVLGGALGWYNAIDGAFDRKLAPLLVFNPDFDNHTFSPSGNLDLDLRVVPILFIPPTLGFLITFPYIQWWRVVKRIQKEQ